MLGLRLCGVSFSYGDPVDILTNIDLHFATGWTGLVGGNGAGKSTLLRLLAGELEPTGGHVAVSPRSARLRLCPQRVDERSEEIELLAGDFCADAARLRSQLGLESSDLERWSTLSPGQRRRWQIAATLALTPDVLLLDEPTNHIDEDARSQLLSALRRFRGIGVLVSHDRAFLDNLTTDTVRLDCGYARSYRGSYASARASWEREEEALRQSAVVDRERHKSLERRLARERRARAQMAAKLSTRKRMKGKRDSDARSAGAKARIANAEARASRRVHVARGAAERAADDVARHSFRKGRGRSLFVDYRAAPMMWLTRLQVPALGYGGEAVLSDVNVDVHRGSRVHVRGANGSGKTTLLSALVDGCAHRERCLYLPQECSPERETTLLDTIRTSSAEMRSRIFNVAAALGLDPDRVVRSPQPSPGELRKLMLAQGLAEQVWALLLDEPTNHLDLPSIERLQEALVAYPGALILVSHDHELAMATTNEAWQIEGRRVTLG